MLKKIDTSMANKKNGGKGKNFMKKSEWKKDKELL